MGNRLTKVEADAATTCSYDEANQLGYEETPSAHTTFSYDANGNLATEQAESGSTTYSWDFENMCVAMALASGARSTFAYDAALKRRSAEDSAGLVRFVHDGENVLVETDSGGATQVSYTLEPSLRPAGRPAGGARPEHQRRGNLISQRRGSASSWHHFDALGSTDRVTDVSESELASYVQTAFGVPKATTGPHPNRLRWIGRLGYRWEPDTSQYDVRRRRYDPQRGRWVSGDPIWGRANRYVHAANRATSAADPGGLLYRCEDVVLGIEVLAGTATIASHERTCKAVEALYGSMADSVAVLGFVVVPRMFRHWVGCSGHELPIEWDALTRSGQFRGCVDDLWKVILAEVRRGKVKCCPNGKKITFQKQSGCSLRPSIRDMASSDLFNSVGHEVDEFGADVEVISRGTHLQVRAHMRMRDLFEFHRGHGWAATTHFMCNPLDATGEDIMPLTPPPLPAAVKDDWGEKAQKLRCAKPFWAKSERWETRHADCYKGP